MSLLVADRLARSLVRATIDVAAVSHRLARGELDARADPAAPVEVGVVAGALNTLAGRISELLREERETVADLSHRVRTPLTALRLDAEALPRAEDAARIGAGVDAVQRAVTVGDRRGPPARPPTPRGATPPRWSPSGSRSGRCWPRTPTGTSAPTSPPARCRSRSAGRDLEALVDALLGNVFAHTAGRHRLRRAARPPAGRRGPAAGRRRRSRAAAGADVLRRGASGGGSTGLGLDIARRTAEQAGGGLTLGRSARGGLAVTVDLGPVGPGAGPPGP